MIFTARKFLLPASAKYICTLCFFHFTLVAATAQINAEDSLNKFKTTEYALRLHYGVIYAHSIHVQNTAGAHPRGFDFEISKQKTDFKNWNYYRCFPRSGFLFSFFDFNTPILGKSFSASYFLEPNYAISPKCDFVLKTAAGISYMTNPHDSIKNPDNQSYSLPINFFLELGVGINYKITKHVAINFMANFQHNSNGGFEQPNRGVNYPSASLGIRYNPVSNKFPVYQRIKDTGWNKKPEYKIGIFYSPKDGYNAAWQTRRKTLGGINAQVSKQVSHLDAITFSTEIYYDAGIKSIKENLHDYSSNVFAGLLIGHEFLFNRIIFSQQLGLYIHKNTYSYTNIYMQTFPLLYHRWGLMYKVKPHWLLGFNMLVHEDVADFIDVRLQYKF